MTESTSMLAKIGLYHSARNSDHMRLFQEIFPDVFISTGRMGAAREVDDRMYRLFPMFPEAMLAPPAFVSELMGLTVYGHIDGVPRRILADEPEARERVRALLREVMTDEWPTLASAGNFLGPLGCARLGLMVESMYRAFFREHSGDDTTLQRRADGAGTGRRSITAPSRRDASRRAGCPRTAGASA